MANIKHNSMADRTAFWRSQKHRRPFRRITLSEAPVLTHRTSLYGLLRPSPLPSAASEHGVIFNTQKVSKSKSQVRAKFLDYDEPTNSRLDNRQAGFTLVELMLSITIMSLMMTAIIGVSTYYFAQITRNAVMTDMTVDSQNLLRTTVENLRDGAGVRQTNTISDPNAPAGGWTTSNTNFIIVIAVPATDSNHDYIIDASTGNPYNNELVYFKNGSTLMERVLANPSATGNTIKTTCPANLATTSCPADKFLTDNVDSMVFTLYDQDNAGATNPLLARSVKIDLNLSKHTFGGTVSFANSIRVTLRNRYP